MSTHNYCFYQGGGNAFGTAPGDFTLLSVGPEVSAPTLVEGRTVRLGLRGTVLVERYRVAMEESAYQEEVLPELGGIEPKNGLRGVLFRPSVGLDAAFALASRRPAPEFVFSLDAGYNTGFGVVVTPSLGLRVGAGG